MNVNPRIEASGVQMQVQRAQISAAKEQKTRQTAANKSKARRMDIPAVLVDDDEQSRRALELLGESLCRRTEQDELHGKNNL